MGAEEEYAHLCHTHVYTCTHAPPVSTHVHMEELIFIQPAHTYSPSYSNMYNLYMFSHPDTQQFTRSPTSLVTHRRCTHWYRQQPFTWEPRSPPSPDSQQSTDLQDRQPPSRSTQRFRRAGHQLLPGRAPPSGPSSARAVPVLRAPHLAHPGEPTCPRRQQPGPCSHPRIRRLPMRVRRVLSPRQPAELPGQGLGGTREGRGHGTLAATTHPPPRCSAVPASWPPDPCALAPRTGLEGRARMIARMVGVPQRRPD